MTAVSSRSSLLHSLSRGGLLAAALLYLAGTAIDPLLHDHAADAPGGSALFISGDGYPDPPDDRRSHSDPECLLCKLPGAALPTTAQAGPETTTAAPRSSTPAAGGHATRAYLLPQPRAPPFV